MNKYYDLREVNRSPSLNLQIPIHQERTKSLQKQIHQTSQALNETLFAQYSTIKATDDHVMKQIRLWSRKTLDLVPKSSRLVTLFEQTTEGIDIDRLESKSKQLDLCLQIEKLNKVSDHADLLIAENHLEEAAGLVAKVQRANLLTEKCQKWSEEIYKIVLNECEKNISRLDFCMQIIQTLDFRDCPRIFEIWRNHIFSLVDRLIIEPVSSFKPDTYIDLIQSTYAAISRPPFDEIGPVEELRLLDDCADRLTEIWINKLTPTHFACMHESGNFKKVFNHNFPKQEQFYYRFFISQFTTIDVSPHLRIEDIPSTASGIGLLCADKIVTVSTDSIAQKYLPDCITAFADHVYYKLSEFMRQRTFSGLRRMIASEMIAEEEECVDNIENNKLIELWKNRWIQIILDDLATVDKGNFVEFVKFKLSDVGKQYNNNVAESIVSDAVTRYFQQQKFTDYSDVVEILERNFPNIFFHKQIQNSK